MAPIACRNSSIRPNQTNSLSYTWTISPTMVNEALATVSLDDVYIPVDLSSGLYDRTKYGIDYPYIFPTGKEVPNRIPTLAIPNFYGLNGGPYPSHSSGPIYDFSDNLTKVAGNHTLKFGVLYEYSGENDGDEINVNGVPGGTNNQNGRFQFSDSRTGGGATSGVAYRKCRPRAFRCVLRNWTARLYAFPRQHVGNVRAGFLESEFAADH